MRDRPQHSRRRKSAPPLDEERLRALALRYVERYATSREKLLRYLDRKLRERGWEGEAAADPARIANRFVELGYVDDRLFGEAKARSLAARGYGVRRVSASLREAGLAEGLRSDITAEIDRRAALDRFAQRRRLGPYAEVVADVDTQRKQFAACLRAGHDFDLVKALFAAETADEFLEVGES